MQISNIVSFHIIKIHDVTPTPIYIYLLGDYHKTTKNSCSGGLFISATELIEKCINKNKNNNVNINTNNYIDIFIELPYVKDSYKKIYDMIMDQHMDYFIKYLMATFSGGGSSMQKLISYKTSDELIKLENRYADCIHKNLNCPHYTNFFKCDARHSYNVISHIQNCLNITSIIMIHFTYITNKDRFRRSVEVLEEMLIDKNNSSINIHNFIYDISKTFKVDEYINMNLMEKQKPNVIYKILSDVMNGMLIHDNVDIVLNKDVYNEAMKKIFDKVIKNSSERYDKFVDAVTKIKKMNFRKYLDSTNEMEVLRMTEIIISQLLKILTFIMVFCDYFIENYMLNKMFQKRNNRSKNYSDNIS